MWNKDRSLRWIQSLLFLLYRDGSSILFLMSCIYSPCDFFLNFFYATNYRFKISTPFSGVDIRRTICNVPGWIFWDVGLKNVFSFSFCSSVKYWINVFASSACAFKNSVETVLKVNFRAKMAVLEETSRNWMCSTSCCGLSFATYKLEKVLLHVEFLQDFFYEFQRIF